MPFPLRARVAGHTLPELVISLSLATILASLALPAFANLLRQQQGSSVIHTLANLYQLARTTAISSGKPVVFCARASESACGTDWRQGVLVFTDSNSNNQLDPLPAERALGTLEPLPAGSRLAISTFGNRRYLRFTARGTLEDFTAGNLVYCPPGGQARDARNLIFTRMGRLRFGTDRNHDGIRENAEGQPLGCPS